MTLQVSSPTRAAPARALLASGLLVALAVVAIACDAPTTVVTGGDAGGIAVTGSGSVAVTPDIATLSVGVEVQGLTVAEARSDGAAAQADVIASLRRNGVEERDIKTQGLSIRAVYGTRPVAAPRPLPGPVPPTPLAIPPIPPIPPIGTPSAATPESGGRSAPANPAPQAAGAPVIVGYVLTNTVSVKVRNLDVVSKVVDDAAAAGGDRVRLSGIAFEVEDPARYAAQARELAVNDARTRAEALARLAGVRLGAPRSINEFGGPTPLAAKGLGGAVAAEAATPINPGEAEVRMQVSIVYEIR